jgi:hypothetical protein
MKRAWAALLVTLVVVLPARLYAVFNLVDSKTGFYADGGKFIGVTALVTAAGMAAVIFFGTRGVPARTHAPLRSAAAAVFAALSGVFIAGESLVSLAGSGGPTVMVGVLALLGVCAAASFLMAAYDFASGETVLRQHPMVALLSPLWGCLCLISLFVDYAAVVNRFENVYHTFTVAFLLLFLFSQTKLLSGVDEERGGRFVFSYGFAAVIMALTDAVPNLALLFAGRNTLGSFPTGLYATNLFLSVYILVYLAALGRRKTVAPMVSITPDTAGSGRSAGAGDQPQTSAGGDRPAQSACDPEPKVLDFLKKAYRSEDKFVEKGDHSPEAAESLKS